MRTSLSIQPSLSRISTNIRGFSSSYQPPHQFQIKRYIDSFNPNVPESEYKPENGDKYYGDLNSNKEPHGYGTYKFQSQNNKNWYYYTGLFQNGEFNGYGLLWKKINQNQGIICYAGEWKNGKRKGKGKEYYTQDSRVFYEGVWQNDQRSGKGSLVFLEGKYEGEWQNGRMNGQGTLFLQKGSVVTAIQGPWIDDDIQNGRIKYYSRQNPNQPIATYKGNIKNLMRDGHGTYTQGQLQLQGIFKQDDLVSSASLKSINSNNKQIQYRIDGDFVNSGNRNKPRTKATITYKNGDRYEGQVYITNDGLVKRVRGKYFFADGEVKQGQFQDGNTPELKIIKNWL